MPRQDFSEELARAFEMPNPHAEAPPRNPRLPDLDEILRVARSEALGRDFAERLF